MIENYVVYLEYIDNKINKFFKRQSPYIMCKKGCALCCKNAQIPYSKIEMDYLMLGMWQLGDNTKCKIADNVNKVLKERESFTGDVFTYDCPFLIDDVCSVYKYRGLVCRAFGLANVGSDGRIKVPFCSHKGLNYSNVIEDGGNKISMEKFARLNIKEEPLAFNVNYNFLTNDDFAKGFNFEFGEKKPLIDWFVHDEVSGQKTLDNN